MGKEKSSSPIVEPVEMDWPDAQRAILNGKRVTRREWGNEGIQVFLADGLLKIRKGDMSLHALLVSDGDMSASDWIVVRDQ